MAKNRFLAFLKYLFILVFISGGVLAILRQQDILDWYKLRNYSPPAQVTSLTTDTGMTSFSQKIFYVNQPNIQNKAQFYVSCEENDTTIVLGCYKPGNGIYLLNVDDPRLNGIEQVTAAHEMLHAAYERLNDSQKSTINSQLNNFYTTLANPQIKAKISQYQQRDADITNELHSIIGTEVGNLPPELETYYAKYFVNRSKVVAYATTYQSVFTERKNKLQQYDTQLAAIEEKIRINNEELLRQQAVINNESDRLNKLKAAGDINGYNAGVPGYNKLLQPYRSLSSQTQSLINNYKSILEARNAVAAEAQELNKALDSRIQSPSEQKI